MGARLRGGIRGLCVRGRLIWWTFWRGVCLSARHRRHAACHLRFVLHSDHRLGFGDELVIGGLPVGAGPGRPLQQQPLKLLVRARIFEGQRVVAIGGTVRGDGGDDRRDHRCPAGKLLPSR